MIYETSRPGQRRPQTAPIWSSVGKTALTPVESIAQVNYESLQGIAETGTVNYESLQGLSLVGDANWESLQAGVESIGAVNWESMVGFEVTGAVNYEVIQDDLFMVGEINYESLQGVSQTGVVNHESQGGIETTGVGDVNWESVSTGNVPWRSSRRQRRYRSGQQLPGDPGRG